MSANPIYDEHLLFARVAEGDEDAFKEIYRMYDRLLKPYLTELTHSPAQTGDLIQETMLRLWIYRDKLKDIEYPRAYVFRIAANRAFSWLKANAGRQYTASEVTDHAEHERPAIESTLSVKAITDVVQQAIRSMPAQRSRIYLMNREQGMKPAEIAQLLGISVSTVNNTLHQSVKYIREQVEKAGFTLPLWFLLHFL